LKFGRIIRTRTQLFPSSSTFTGNFDKKIKNKIFELSLKSSEITDPSKNNPVKHNYMWDGGKQEEEKK